MTKRLSILGIRGIPASYGGFETLAQRLALYLVSRGWQVTVYCQDVASREVREWVWRGIHLVHVPTPYAGPLGSILFDWRSTRHAARRGGIVLTLGYNTASFGIWYRLRSTTNLINMDGLEWRRQKWRLHEKAWLYLNDLAARLLGDHLVADHPEIKSFLTRESWPKVSPHRVELIPVGADPIGETDVGILKRYGLTPKGYALVIGRAEPENSILEMVLAFSRTRRGIQLVILGDYQPAKFPFHREVTERASDEVVFLGTIFEKPILDTLRTFARIYLHGHTVGGTNPSLIESMAAASPVLARNNRFNRWTAGSAAHYFADEQECADQLDSLLYDEEQLARMGAAGLERYHDVFGSNQDVKSYESLVSRFIRN